MDEIEWLAIRADILDLAGADPMGWIRINTLVDRAHQRGLTTGTGPLLASALAWAEEEGLAELHDGPPILGAVRLTATGAR